MDYTTNYGLRKPEPTDYYDVADANFNMDKIDLTLKDNENAIANHTAATTGVHGATSAATPNTIVQRDSAGRAKVAAPAAADDIARKDTVDAVQTNLTNHINATTGVHGATSAATPNTLVQRDPNGRFKAAAPVAADDVARKAEVDARVSKSGDTMTGTLTIQGGQLLQKHSRPQHALISTATNEGVRTEYREDQKRLRWQSTDGNGGFVGQLAYLDCQTGEIYLTPSGHKAWHAGNDGAGSGLDADMLDGMQSDRFIFGDNERGSVLYSSGDLNDITKSGFYHTSSSVLNQPPGVSSGFCLHIQHPSNNAHAIQIFQGGIGNNAQFYVRRKSDTGWGDWGKLWTEFNDGAGSGLDADMLDGMQPSTSASANTIAQRDSSGRIKAAAPSASDDVVRKAELDGHANRTDNPHGVTKSQVGLGNVQNYGIASQSQAEAGTANNVYMTPLRTKEAIDRQVFGNTGNITLYVSPSGDDSNSGTSSGSPLKTIQAALAKIPKLYFGTANINLAAGTYNEDVEITGFMGNGNIHLNGASALEQASSYKVRSVSSHDNTCYVRISGIEGTSTSTSAGPIRSTRDSMCWIRYCLINVSATSSPGFEFNQTRAYITECTVNNRGRGITARYNALVTVNNVGGSGNSVGLRVESGGVIAKAGGSMPGGSTSESITTGGEIR